MRACVRVCALCVCMTGQACFMITLLECFQFVIEANIIPPLIRLLETAEFDIRKEAAWALSNATSGGSPMQIKYLVNRGAISPLCSLLVVPDHKIISVALEGLENILKVGQMEREMNNSQINECARLIEECGGSEKMVSLEHSENPGMRACFCVCVCVRVCLSVCVSVCLLVYLTLHLLRCVFSEIYDRVQRILRTYFDSSDDEEPEGPAPGTATAQFPFGFAPPPPPGAGAPTAAPFNAAPVNPFLNMSSVGFR